MSPSSNKPSPPPGSIWERIEYAREALGWDQSTMGTEALENRSHYSKVMANWNPKFETIERLIRCLVDKQGFSEVWLRSAVGPEKADGSALPEPRTFLTQLRTLAGRLGLPEQELLTLWADPQGEGPLQKLPEDVQRAAFAAAYLEGRSFEDVRQAARQAMRSPSKKGAGVDHWLAEIRRKLETIKPGSGTRPGLVLIPAKEQ